MKTYNAYLQIGAHPQFKELTDYPPQGVHYYVDGPSKDYGSRLIDAPKKTLIGNLQVITGIPRFTAVKANGCDLIHATRGFLVLNRKPWVVDLESAAAFTGLNWQPLRQNPFTRRIIVKLLSSKYCKRVLPQCDAAKKTLFDWLDCRKIADKIETLYPAYRVSRGKRKEVGRVRLSFLGQMFFLKGGHDLLKAFEILNKKYDIELKVKSKAPEEFKLKLANIKYIESVKLTKEELYDEMFFNTDIYVQPTYVDSFGISVLEAMSTGMPVVTTDDFALPEIVEDGYNGLLVHADVVWDKYIYKEAHLKNFIRDVREYHPDVIKQLVEKISILIEDSSLRRKMGRRNHRLVESGKFSINVRNKKLREIYENALRS